MCSGCSGDYCGGFEEPDFLPPEDSGSSKSPAHHFGQGSSKRRPSEQHQEANRDPDPDRPNTRAYLYKSDELARPHQWDTGATGMRCQDDYEILVSATQITEIRRIAKRSSAVDLIGSSAAGAGDGRFQSRAQARPEDAKHYQTSEAGRSWVVRTTTLRLIWLIVSGLAATPLVRLFLWLMLR